METKARLHRAARFISSALAFAVSGVLLTAGPGVADPKPSADVLAVRTHVFEDGSTFSLRALPPAEIRARGLVPAGTTLKVVAPRIIDATSSVSAQGSAEPVRQPAGEREMAATACFQGGWDQGLIGAGPLKLYTHTDVTWCATNTWISSTWTGCNGVDGGYPTYEHLGCSQSQAYGVGWSAWDVKTTGNHCYAWVGYCASTTTVWSQYRMNGYGDAVLTGRS